MKVAIVIESLNIGGAEKSLINLLDYLVSKNLKLDLYLFQKGGELEAYLPNNLNLIYLPEIKLNLLERIIFKLEKKLYPKVHSAQLFRKHALAKFDLLNIEYDIGVAYNQGLATYFVAEKIKAIKKFAWINVDYEKANYHLDRDLQYYKKFNEIITVSEYNKSKIIKLIAKSPLKKNVHVLKDLINFKHINQQSDKLYPKEFDNGFFNLLTVARLVKAKRIDIVIFTAKLLVKQNMKFKWFIIGEGNQRKTLEKLINKFMLEEHVILLGSKTNPYPYIKNCSIYIQTSDFEGLGLTLLEAKFFNKPIVSTDFDTAFEILNNYPNSYICKNKPHKIQKCINKAILDKKKKSESVYVSQFETYNNYEMINTIFTI